jgi:hypothetical protein
MKDIGVEEFPLSQNFLKSLQSSFIHFNPPFPKQALSQLILFSNFVNLFAAPEEALY